MNLFIANCQSALTKLAMGAPWSHLFVPRKAKVKSRNDFDVEAKVSGPEGNSDKRMMIVPMGGLLIPDALSRSRTKRAHLSWQRGQSHSESQAKRDAAIERGSSIISSSNGWIPSDAEMAMYSEELIPAAGVTEGSASQTALETGAFIDSTFVRRRRSRPQRGDWLHSFQKMKFGSRPSHQRLPHHVPEAD